MEGDRARPTLEPLRRPRASRTMAAMHFLVLYDYVPDILARREPFRAEHLRLALDAHARGEMVLGGALADPVDGCVLLFRGDTDAAAQRFVAADPYVRHGLVTRWRIRAWTTVVGDEAAFPIRRESGG